MNEKVCGESKVIDTRWEGMLPQGMKNQRVGGPFVSRSPFVSRKLHLRCQYKILLCVIHIKDVKPSGGILCS